MESLIARLTTEDHDLERDRRSLHRTPLVRPVNVLVNDEKTLSGFSKNVSTAGMGMIIPEELAEGTIAKLCIHSLRGRPVTIRSELRWCQPFGNGWFLSGWKFLTEVRG